MADIEEESSISQRIQTLTQYNKGWEFGSRRLYVISTTRRIQIKMLNKLLLLFLFISSHFFEVLSCTNLSKLVIQPLARFLLNVCRIPSVLPTVYLPAEKLVKIVYGKN